MNKFSKITLLVWCILAVISFIISFWAPVFFKIVWLTFGSLDMLIVLGLVFTWLQTRYNNKLEDKEDVQMQTNAAQTEH